MNYGHWEQWMAAMSLYPPGLNPCLQNLEQWFGMQNVERPHEDMMTPWLYAAARSITNPENYKCKWHLLFHELDAFRCNILFTCLKEFGNNEDIFGTQVFQKLIEELVREMYSYSDNGEDWMSLADCRNIADDLCEKVNCVYNSHREDEEDGYSLISCENML